MRAVALAARRATRRACVSTLYGGSTRATPAVCSPVPPPPPPLPPHLLLGLPHAEHPRQPHPNERHNIKRYPRSPAAEQQQHRRRNGEASSYSTRARTEAWSKNCRALLEHRRADGASRQDRRDELQVAARPCAARSSPRSHVLARVEKRRERPDGQLLDNGAEPSTEKIARRSNPSAHRLQ